MDLPIEIQDKFEKIDNQIEDCFENNNHSGIIELELQKWNLLPLPKEKYDESFFIAHSLANEYMEIQDHNNSKKWAEILFSCDLERLDDGEREFVAGKVHFAADNLERALEYFKRAYQKSEGRAFPDDNPAYLEFYNNPDQYIK
ncbi:hypothetical protein [Chryseobacterium caseinilyticum]|uniref:Tetratricopeptide repeat protein n=1 Tax=Chryseobacterium caseinilyticum TaxID=2771428 RepID=A0ABR8ZB99_9FLAO|nr:hypothetical protein [Chryseobacterium caseinilyticum]MBD8082522.1 hypothetical protein [Chryseobacterium caseinilyticum]